VTLLDLVTRHREKLAAAAASGLAPVQDRRLTPRGPLAASV
jgi:hypothetical protein